MKKYIISARKDGVLVYLTTETNLSTARARAHEFRSKVEAEICATLCKNISIIDKGSIVVINSK